MATLAPKIAQAKSAGYSDDEIVGFLSRQDPEKFRKAKDAGYSASEIISHLGSQPTLPEISVDEKPKPKSEVDDHGLARRQAMLPLEKAISPITEYPRNYDEIRTEAGSQFGRGLGQMAQGFGEGLQQEPGSVAGLRSLGTFAKGAANTGLGALGYVASPISAAYRSIVGQPIEDTTGIPREQTEFAAQLLTPGIGFTKLPKAPGVADPVPLIRPVEMPAPQPDVAQAANRLVEAGHDVSVPRGVTGGRVAQEVGQGASNIPIVGQPIAEAIHTTLPAQLQRARDTIAAEHGAGTGANVAERVGTTLKDDAATEAAAAKAEAARADAQATAEWQRAQAEREAAIAQQEQQAATAEQQSGRAVQQSVGPDLHPQDMGETVINHVRANEQAAENLKNGLYGELATRNGTISDNAVGSMDRDIRSDLLTEHGPADGVVRTHPQLTPAAHDMEQQVRAIAQRARERQAAAEAEAIAGGGTAEDAAATGIPLRMGEQNRQVLLATERQATLPADRRAARRIMQAYDDWHNNAMHNHFEGDADALDLSLRARAANRDYRERFGYNKHDDADRMLNKIVRGEIDQHTGPVEVSNALTRGGDKSGPFYTSVMDATGNSPEVAQAVRSGTWNKLTRTDEGVPRAPHAVRRDVITYLHGKGRDVAGRAFDQRRRDLMRAHADTVVQTEAQQAAAATQRRAAARITRATEPAPTKPEVGPIQQLADRVVGKGHSYGEALYDTLHGYATKGGDVTTLSHVVQRLPQSLRGDLASTFIRKLGTNAAGDFTLDQFARQWNDITPQAKAVLFGNAGSHVTSLNDIAIVARRLKEVQGRFGNPSKSARNIMFGSLPGFAALALQAPKTAALSAAGYGTSHIAARILSNPASAAGIARYVRAVERAEKSGTLAHMTAANVARRNVENTVRSIAASGNRQ